MLDPASVGTALAVRAAATAISVGAQRLGVIALGERERRSLRSAVRSSVMEAALAHEAIARISADIDLAGREDVIDELFAASVPNRRTHWPRTRSAWTALYGGEAPQALIDMLADAAADLRARLQRSPLLRGLWSALTLEGVSDQVAVVDDRITQLIDPEAAIRFRGPEIAGAPARAIAIAGALANQMAQGEAGRLLGIEAVGADGSLRIHLQPGADLQFKVTKLVPNTPEGRAELERLSEAMESGEPIDMGEVSIETHLGGQVVQLFPETGHLTSGPATRDVTVILTVTSPSSGIEERVVLKCFGTRRGDTFELVAQSGNRGLLRADITLDLPTRRATFRFHLATEGALRLADQILIHRVLASFSAGGMVEMYIAEFNLNSRTEFEPRSEFDQHAAALVGLELLAEVSSLLGVDADPLDSFTGDDVALLGWARQLLTTGDAPMLPGAGSATLSGTNELWTSLKSGARPDGSIDFLYREDAMTLELGDRTLDLGPVWHRIRGAQLPSEPRHEGRETVVDITWDEKAVKTVTRIQPNEDGAELASDDKSGGERV